MDDAQTHKATLQPGTIIGAYRIIQLLGAGGMGQVWLGEHQKLGRRAAIKVLHPQYSAQPEIVQRFFNEARAATAISDPGIVQIFDFGNHTDGSAYIVMEMLDGEPLDRRLRTQGPLPTAQALRLIRQVATSLAAAHARGIVHRDLKPENIYVVRDAEVAGGERTKLLDFGIAKLTDDTQGRWRTSTSAVMGTPVYMSPEQCRGAGEVDLRSDLYSLGCVLFQLLTGRLPFEAAGTGDIIAMHLREPAPPPSIHNSNLPPAIDELVLRCLAKDPGQRFASGLQLAIEIEGLLANPLVGPRVQTPLPFAISQTVTSDPAIAHRGQPTTLSAAASSGATIGPTGSSRRGMFTAMGLVVAVAAIAIGIVVSTSSNTITAASPGPATEPVSTRDMIDAGITIAPLAPDASIVAPTPDPIVIAAPVPAPVAQKPVKPRTVARAKRAAESSPTPAVVATPAKAERSLDDNGDGIPDRR